MEIKEAVIHAREEGLTEGLCIEPTNYIGEMSFEAICTISGALKNGYTLCRCNLYKAVDKMKDLAITYATNAIYDSRAEAVLECLNIIKEACE